jgi:hypothetical protein
MSGETILSLFNPEGSFWKSRHEDPDPAVGMAAFGPSDISIVVRHKSIYIKALKKSICRHFRGSKRE